MSRAGEWADGIAEEVMQAAFKGRGVERHMKRADVKALVLVALERAAATELLEACATATGALTRWASRHGAEASDSTLNVSERARGILDQAIAKAAGGGR